MGMTAENVAERYGVTRAEQDAMAVDSHTKALAAQAQGKFDAETVPVETRAVGGDGTERAVVVLESCYALSMAPAIAASLRLGARVFATDACYNQEHLKFVLDASGDLVPMLFDPWHTSSMQVVVASDCHDMPWVAPEWLRTLGVTGCADVTMDVCLSDDADGEVLDRKGQGPASACCRCGAGRLM